MEIVKINDHEYIVGKLDVFQQFHVVRRMAPFLAGLGAALEAKEKGAGIMEALSGPFAGVLASMEDKEVNYILQTCLNVCQRRTKVGNDAISSPVLLKGTTQLMFEDLTMNDMIQLVSKVIGENLQDFFVMTQQFSLTEV